MSSMEEAMAGGGDGGRGEISFILFQYCKCLVSGKTLSGKKRAMVLLMAEASIH